MSGAEERAAVVAYLRSLAPDAHGRAERAAGAAEAIAWEAIALFERNLAAAIERGEHVREGEK